jgi:hypothetical protein
VNVEAGVSLWTPRAVKATPRPSESSSRSLPIATPGKTIPIKDLLLERKWVGYYGGVMAYRRDNSADGDLSLLSPDYSDQEIGHIWDGNKFATPYLLPEVVALDLTKTNKLAVPANPLSGPPRPERKCRRRRRVLRCGEGAGEAPLFGLSIRRTFR